MSSKEYRLGMANLILDSFVPGVMLYQGNRELRMCWDMRKPPPKYDLPARLRHDGSWPAYGYHQRPTGGTGFQAIAQIIRYVRDLTRLPIITWKYWAGDRVMLANARTLELIIASDYGNPAKTRCILCGTTEFKNGLDWWSLDGKVGPCCSFGLCRKEVT